MADPLALLQTAFADRYAIERELGRAAWPRSISPATSSTSGQQDAGYLALMAELKAQWERWAAL